MSFDPTIIVEQIGSASILGLIGLTIVGNLFPGIPEELFLLFVGVAVGFGLMDFWLAFIIIFVMLNIIDHCLYFLARGGIKIFVKIQKKIFPRLDIHGEFIKSHLDKITFLSRFVFQIRFLGPFLAGANHMKIRRFTILNSIALAIYVPFMLYVGSYFHDRIEQMTQGVEVIRNIVLVALFILILIFLFKYLKKRFMGHVSEDKKGPLAGFGITRDKK